MTCFLEGTLIATPDGERPVERLVPGDLVSTAGGVARPVRWIGTRTVDLAALYGGAVPPEAHPVRVRRDAMAPGLPWRDLLVTPEHCLLLDGGLIPARMLVNGRSIRHDPALRHFTVFHVELDSHDILLAEGIEAESWLDTGNRDLFGNAPVTRLRPEFAVPAAVPAMAAPLLVDRAAVEPVWRRLDARADALGLPARPAPAPLTTEHGLAVRLDGGAVLPMREAVTGRYEVELPAGAAAAALLSRAVVPAAADGPFNDDRRRLGVAVVSVVLTDPDGASQVLPCRGRGWHDEEADGAGRWSWTSGDAVLAMAAAGCERLLSVTLRGSLAYPIERRAVAA